MSEDEEAPSSQQPIPPAAVFFVGLILGVGLILMGQTFTPPAEDSDLADRDGDGVPDSHDLEPEGDARMRWTAVSLKHGNLSANTTFNLTIWYDGNGDPGDDSDGQSCTLTFIGISGTNSTSPAQGCTFQTSDWTLLAVGFGYHLNSSEPAEADHTLYKEWDLFPGLGTDTTGYNSSVDAWSLHEGATIVLDGIDDGDDNEWNASLTLVSAADDV